jgi:hypothetical protein
MPKVRHDEQVRLLVADHARLKDYRFLNSKLVVLPKCIPMSAA